MPRKPAMTAVEKAQYGKRPKNGRGYWFNLIGGPWDRLGFRIPEPFDERLELPPSTKDGQLLGWQVYTARPNDENVMEYIHDVPSSEALQAEWESFGCNATVGTTEWRFATKNWTMQRKEQS